MSYTQNPKTIPVTKSDDPHDTLHELSCVMSALGALLQDRTMEDLDAMGTRDSRPIQGLSIILENVGDQLYETTQDMERQRRNGTFFYKHLRSKPSRTCDTLLTARGGWNFLMMAAIERINQACEGSKQGDPIPYNEIFNDMDFAAAEQQAKVQRECEEFDSDVKPDGIVNASDGAVEAA